MEVTADSERLRGYRKMIVELLFAEGTHLLRLRGQRQLRAPVAGAAARRGSHPFLVLVRPPGRGRLTRAIRHRSPTAASCARAASASATRSRGTHLGCHGAGDRCPGHHRPRTALGRVQLHRLRQVRERLPDRRAIREGQGRERDGEAPRPAAIAVDHARAAAVSEVTEAMSQEPGRVDGAAPGEGPAATVWLDGCSAATCRCSILTSGRSRSPSTSTWCTPLIDVKSYPEQVDVALVEAQLAARRIWRRSAVSAARPDPGGVRRLRRDRQRPLDAQCLPDEDVYRRGYIETATLWAWSSRPGRPKAAPRSGRSTNTSRRRLPPGLPAARRRHLRAAHRPGGRPHAGFDVADPFRR